MLYFLCKKPMKATRNSYRVVPSNWVGPLSFPPSQTASIAETDAKTAEVNCVCVFTYTPGWQFQGELTVSNILQLRLNFQLNYVKSRSRPLLEKLVITQLIKKFFAFWFPKAPSCVNKKPPLDASGSNNSKPHPHPVFVLYSRPVLGLASYLLFPGDFLTKTAYELHMHTAYPAVSSNFLWTADNVWRRA